MEEENLVEGICKGARSAFIHFARHAKPQGAQLGKAKASARVRVCSLCNLQVAATTPEKIRQALAIMSGLEVLVILVHNDALNRDAK